MATVILSAGSDRRPSLRDLETIVRTELAQVGERDIQTFELESVKLAFCQGEFDCWLATPGSCRSHDFEQDLVQAIHDADNLILIDAITFGGHSYTVKRAQDRTICLLSPMFEKRTSLTHHRMRYDKLPSMFALGWLPAPDEDQARTWRELADANAINMLAPRVGTAVVDDAHRDEWAAEICVMLRSLAHPGANIHRRGPLRHELEKAARPDPLLAPPSRVRTAALLIGSAKIKGTSASENLARALAQRLEIEDVATELHFATEFVHAGKAETMAASIAKADLFVLVTPLYIDALPALVVRALESVVRARETSPPGMFATIINCGFPEPEHTRTAMRIAHHFASAAGYHWAGGLPLGGGGFVKPKVPLDAQHGPAIHVRRALDAAAPTLAAGDNVPELALVRMMESPMPDFVYRLIADLGWRYQVHQHGLAQRELRARPLDHPASP